MQNEHATADSPLLVMHQVRNYFLVLQDHHIAKGMDGIVQNMKRTQKTAGTGIMTVKADDLFISLVDDILEPIFKQDLIRPLAT